MTNKLIISATVKEKLKTRHRVAIREVEQCFDNLCGTFLEDDREEHRTDPATLWFVAPTNKDRLLKVIFMVIQGNIHIKSAYDAKQSVIDLYEDQGK